jgi:mannose-6-phosphate isomerase-like protein (cupin superfamily)
MAESPPIFGLADALKRLETDGVRAHYMLRHGSMRVGIYAPLGQDDQQPHRQDELYIVASGGGEFMKEGVVTNFRQGDVIFVEAGAVHRFQDFSADFVAWVVFWGPEGGEA